MSITLEPPTTSPDDWPLYLFDARAFDRKAREFHVRASERELVLSGKLTPVNVGRVRCYDYRELLALAPAHIAQSPLWTAHIPRVTAAGQTRMSERGKSVWIAEQPAAAVPTTVPDLLEAAAAHIERFGLHKGGYRPPVDAPHWNPFFGPADVVGAIRLSAGIDPSDTHTWDKPIPNADELIVAAEETLAEWLVDRGHTPVYEGHRLVREDTIATWSDDVDAAEAAEVLRLCATAARAYPVREVA